MLNRDLNQTQNRQLNGLDRDGYVKMVKGEGGNAEERKQKKSTRKPQTQNKSRSMQTGKKLKNKIQKQNHDHFTLNRSFFLPSSVLVHLQHT